MIEPRLALPGVEVYIGDAKETVLRLAEKYGGKINMVVTSPPYRALRRYLPPGHPDAYKEVGQELTDEEYIDNLCDLFDSIGEHLLREDGSVWVNLGDSYAGSGGAGGDYNEGGLREGQPKWRPPKSEFPAKCLMMVPERFALEMIRRGWILRNRVIWFKGKDVDDPLDDEDGGAPASNGMPVSAEDRLKGTYEVIFHFVRRQQYFYALDAIREAHARLWNENIGGSLAGSDWHKDAGQAVSGGRNTTYKTPSLPNPLGRNPGDLWAIPISPFPLAHFATYPPALVHRPVKATCPEAICKKCGAPRVAIYNTKSKPAKGRDERKVLVPGNREQQSGYYWEPPDRTLVGYTDCGCNAGWTGGIVLDPFFGSGSTAQGVNEARPPVTIDGDYCQPLTIGIDLDDRNLPIIEKRLTGRAKQGRKVDLKRYEGGLLAMLDEQQAD